VLLQGGFNQTPDDRVQDYMHPIEMTIDSRMDILRVAQIFLEKPFRRLAVVDEGKLVGQITRRDIVRGMQRYFE
jgi:predicted transcriptional regulator